MTDLAVVTQDPAYAGGARAQLDAFLAAARELGRDPEVLYVPHPTLRPELRLSPVHRVEALRVLLGSRPLARRLAEARSVWVVAPLAAPGLAARIAGGRYACWIGTTVRGENSGRLPGLSRSRATALRANEPPLRLLERSVLRRAAAVYATSPSSQRGLAATAGRTDVGLLPIPVDTARFAPLPDDEWQARLERPVVVFVGRADDPRKNAQLLLEAVPELRRRVPGATVRLVGRPPRGRLPDGVEAAGEVEAVEEALRGAALFVLPSRQEGFGIVAVEALACGVPVVTTPSGGPEELVRESGGGRVLRGFSPVELATVAAELLGDPATLSAMRRAGRDHVVRRHSPAVFRDLLGGAFVALA